MRLPLFFCFLGLSSAFAPFSPASKQSQQKTTGTCLNAYIDVPYGFFTITMIGAGITMSYAKGFGRLRMEERAWEQRLEEGRKRRLQQDPTLTELDLRRAEAEMEWSAYGKPRLEREMEEEARGARRKVKVMEREEEEDDYVDRSNRMSEAEIDTFEAVFGIDYDPYYDDPYTEDELPEGNYQVDKKYGDRIYQDGEIFYKDAQANVYYRQGAKPRSVNFFSP